MSVIINGITYELPADDSVAQKVPQYNAVLTALAGDASAWASWVPTLTNIAIGTGGGALLSAKYLWIGKLIICRLHIVLGTSGFSVTGDVSFSLPVTRAAYGGSAGQTPLGQVRCLDTSVPTDALGLVTSTTTTSGRVLVCIASGTNLTSAILSSTVPFTWAAGDEINAEFCYEAA